MARAKSTKKKQAKKKSGEPGPIREWIVWAGDWTRYGLSIVFAEHTWRVIGAVGLIGVVSAWAVARGPLMERIARDASDPVSVRFSWPTSSDGSVWLPVAVQEDLERIAHASLTMDPFDQDALARTSGALEATGWLADVESVRRLPGGEVRITGAWRAHAAVVSRGDERHLVATGAEVLKPPMGGLDISRMYVISNPGNPVPRLRDGSIAYGQAWLGPIDESIELLRAVDGMTGSARISGVDLSDYRETGRLSLVTERGSRIVWGSPMGQGVPGEASDEQKLANLERILANGDDLRHRVIEIVLPRVEIDVRGGE